MVPDLSSTKQEYASTFTTVQIHMVPDHESQPKGIIRPFTTMHPYGSRPLGTESHDQ